MGGDYCGIFDGIIHAIAPVMIIGGVAIGSAEFIQCKLHHKNRLFRGTATVLATGISTMIASELVFHAKKPTVFSRAIVKAAMNGHFKLKHSSKIECM